MTQALQPILEPLWAALPQDRAMKALVVVEPIEGLPPVIHKIAQAPSMRDHPRRDALMAGLWLYVDDLEAAHRLCQAHEGTPIFDYWHAILHRREGDFGNSRYWFRRAASHPLLREPHRMEVALSLVNAVARFYEKNSDHAELIERQRREWWALWESLQSSNQ